MQEKRHGTARFVLNKEGQLPFEQLDYVVRQYIAYKHHGKIPLKGVETIEVPLSHSIE